jgi:hypothetical protein
MFEVQIAEGAYKILGPGYSPLLFCLVNKFVGINFSILMKNSLKRGGTLEEVHRLTANVRAVEKT